MEIIDIRSDTVTVPTKEMRKIIASAPVGDDVFGEDPSINELEGFVADLFGKESAIFVPSGVMANQISLHILTNPGDEVIVEADAHIFHYEAAAPSVLSGIQLKPVPTDRGVFNYELIPKLIHPDNEHYPKVSLICIENTHNRHGGTIIPLKDINKIAKKAKENNLKFHCDGARIWEASAATGIELKDWAKNVDTISVCLSKGLGAPVGSLIISTGNNIKKARRFRKILGGGMRQAGLLAAAGKFAIENHFKLLKSTHENAKLFAKKMIECEFFEIDLSKVETNIVLFKHSSKFSSAEFLNESEKAGVRLIQFGENLIRAVFHFQISRKMTIKAAEILSKIANELSKR